jgi:hypothetical protein
MADAKRIQEEQRAIVDNYFSIAKLVDSYIRLFSQLMQ